MELNLIYPPLLGIFGLVVALLLFVLVMRYDGGSDEVKKIGDQIHLGAMVFMRREYTYLALFVSVLIVLSYIFLGFNTALAVTAGALSSSLAGWLGMFAATKANVRTATAASQGGSSISALSSLLRRLNHGVVCSFLRSCWFGRIIFLFRG